MKYGFLFTGLILFLFAGCDDITTEETESPVSILSLEAEPVYIEFTPELPEMDTTINVSLLLQLKEATNSEIRYTLVRNRELLQETTLEPVSDTEYQAEFELNLNTARSEQYTIHAYAPNAVNSETAETSIRIISQLGISPVVEDAFNTEVVQIPGAGAQERVDFYARVVHPADQSLIARVDFLLIDSAGNPIGPIEMFDDGVFNEPAGFIDEVAGDSLYSRALFVDSGNNPDTYDVLYYAIGTNGVSSDTVQTTLQIVQ